MINVGWLLGWKERMKQEKGTGCGGFQDRERFYDSTYFLKNLASTMVPMDMMLVNSDLDTYKLAIYLTCIIIPFLLCT